ncbi:uncharacterized protein [Spinacia oleracea]|uniref:RNase H type-1 domain-containing protein n=1 Tax=Spinacia oleracea TaxID=3562 RepID=A0ABM3R8Y8_SPIOL|nr:uncharacterized protein LOC130467546 [Spinacia oleracea]
MEVIKVREKMVGSNLVINGEEDESDMNLNGEDERLWETAWRLHRNSQLLLSKIYHAKDNSALSLGRTTKIKAGTSWGFRGIRKAENTLLQGCAWKIGSGCNVFAGRDKWMNGRVPVFSSHVCLRDAQNWKVSAFINQQTFQWDAVKVWENFESTDARAILSTELPGNRKDDYLIWPRHKSGNYTVKSGYAYLQDLNKEDTNVNFLQLNQAFYKQLWAFKIPPNWKIFIWKIMLRSLVVKVNLLSRGIQIDVGCLICGDQEEDDQHVFRWCSIARQVWMCGFLGIHSTFKENLSLQEWILYYIRFFIISDGQQGDRLPYFFSTLWALWISRNHKVFRGQNPTVHAVLAQVEDVMTQYRVLLIDIGQGNEGSITYHLQVDAAWQKNSHRAGMGWFLSSTTVVVNGEKEGNDWGMASSASHAEAKACLQGIDWAISHSIDSICIFTDSATLVTNLQNFGTPDYQQEWTLSSILHKGKNFSRCIIHKVDRDRVQQAHNLAQAAIQLGIRVAQQPLEPD